MALWGAEAAHHRRGIEMPSQIARRCQRDCDGREHDCDQRRQAEKLVRPLERLAHFGPQIANRFQALSALQTLLRPGAECVGFASRKQQAIRRAIAGLQQLGRRNVVEVHQELRPQRKQAAGDLGVLLHDRADLQRPIADEDCPARGDIEARREARVDPGLAGRRYVTCRLAFGRIGVGENDRPTQRIAGADGLDVGEHGRRGIPCRLYHAVELNDRHHCKAARARLVGISVRQGPVSRQHQIAAQEQIGLARQCSLDAIGEKSNAADARHREHQRGNENSQLASAPVALEHPHGEPEGIHLCRSTRDALTGR